MKLYKYRSIKNRSQFEYYLKALEEGYLWFADVPTLNDPQDSIIYYDVEKERKFLLDYFEAHKIEIVRATSEKMVSGNLEVMEKISKLSNRDFLEIETCYENDSVSQFLELKGANEIQLKQYEKIKQEFLNKMDSIFKEIEPKILEILNFNETFRENIKVLSLSFDSDNKHLWEKYSENFGFCIEYDLEKIKHVPEPERKHVKELKQVIYTDEREHFSWFPVFLLMFGVGNKEQIVKELELNLETQLITKDQKWSQESEYRFFNNEKNIVNADLVSAIYIHENIIDTDESNRLIELARKRNWKIHVWKPERR